MEQVNLFRILQNVAIGSIALHSFTLGYYKLAVNRKEIDVYPRFEFMFYVLPIIFNKSAMQTFRSSNHLYTALFENKSIVLDLQERANKMAEQTFDSLNLSFSKKILGYNKNDGTIEIQKGFKTNKLPLTSSMQSNDHSIKMIQDSAYKLGSIFAKKDEKALQIDLNIRF